MFSTKSTTKGPVIQIKAATVAEIVSPELLSEVGNIWGGHNINTADKRWPTSMHWTHMMNQPTLLATFEMMESATTRLSWEVTNKMDSIRGAVASTMHTQWTHRRPKRSSMCVKWMLMEFYHEPIRNCPMNTEGSSVRESRLKFVKMFPARFSAFKDPAM